MTRRRSSWPHWCASGLGNRSTSARCWGWSCLRAIGTDTALMQIATIAQKVSFKGLKSRAQECMRAIAEARGLSRAQLEDRIVPDCGLDGRGSRVFDFGPRRFSFALGPDMKPLVRHETGALTTTLPKPGARDDQALASQAVEQWTLIKKQVRAVSRIQAARLKQAMVTGRRWTVEEFETLLVRHPLMTHLVRLLVWGGYDQGGRLAATFRVTEDQTYADQHDEDCTLEGLATVGIVHPAHLSEDGRAAWGQLLSDYQIIPPFPQLGRPVHMLAGGEAAAREITRFTERWVPVELLLGILKRLGWDRGSPEDGGSFHGHSKPYHEANITAVIEYETVQAGTIFAFEAAIGRCFFVPGIYTPGMCPDHRDALLLGEVDPGVLSEVLGDLHVVAGKAQ